jgi:multiple sugar transport system substrate-binding protein
MRNKLLTIALLVILPFFVTACTLKDLPYIGKLFGGSTTTVNKAATIKIWGLWENPEVMDALIAKYKEKNPDVTFVYDDRSILNPTQYRDTLFTRLDEEGDPPADIVLVHNSWVPRIKDKLSPAPDSFMDVATYESTFYPSASDSAIVDNKIYATPFYFDGLSLVYNKAHFASVDQETAPTAWEEFRRLALSLTQKDKDGNLIRAGAAVGTSVNIDFFSDILGLMFAQAGVSVPADIDSKQAQDALSFYTTFVNEDGIWNASMPEASTAFAQEKVSMIFIPSWNLLDILRVRPDLDIGVAPVPQAMPESPVSWGSFWMYAVPSKGANKEAAWDFLKFLSTEEAQLLMFSTASQYRNYGAPYSNSLLREQASSGTASKYIKPYLDTAPFSKSNFFAGRAGNAFAINALKDAVSSVIVPEKDKRVLASDALKSVKEKLTGISTGSGN